MESIHTLVSRSARCSTLIALVANQISRIGSKQPQHGLEQHMHHLSLQPHQLLSQLLAKQRHRARQAFCQRDPGMPAQRRQAAHVQLFLRGASRSVVKDAGASSRQGCRRGIGGSNVSELV